MNRRTSRLRRARKSRAKMRELEAVRLTVYKSNKHMYAQIIQQGEKGDTVLASVSTNQKDNDAGYNIAGAKLLGALIAERAKEKGVQRVAFDRSGYPYFGRVKEIAQAARETGLQL